MKKLSAILFILFAVFAITTHAGDTKLKCAGCKTEAILMKELCDNYSEAKISPSKTGNKKALLLLADNKVNFAFTCKPSPKLAQKFKIDPKISNDWKCVAFAKDPIVVIVNPDTGITELSLIRLSKIFSGNISNWEDVGGNNLPIKLAYMDAKKVETGNNTVFKECTLEKYIKEDGNEVTETPNKTPNKKASFSKKAKLLDSPDKLGNFTKATSGAISFMGLNSYKSKYGTAVTINGVEPNVNSVRSGKYPMAVTYHLVYDSGDTGAIKAFIDFALSDKGKQITDKNFVAIDAVEVK